MSMQKRERSMWKEQMKIFHNIAGKKLVEKGFRKKQNTYYRILGDQLFQVVSFGWLSMRNYELHFDIFPLYGNYFGINHSPAPFDELASIPISMAVKGTRDFNLQLDYLIEYMIDEFDEIDDARKLITYLNKWNQYIQAVEDLWEDCDEESLEEENYIKVKYPFVEDASYGLGTASFYAGVKAGLFDDVLKSVVSEFFWRVGSNEYDMEMGFKTAEQCENDLKRFKETFWQEFEIKKLLEEKNYSAIELLLKKNLENNYSILKNALHLDLSDWDGL